MGTYLETKTELTLPFLSQAQFGKVELNYRRFYDAIVLKKYFDRSLIKYHFAYLENSCTGQALRPTSDGTL